MRYEEVDSVVPGENEIRINVTDAGLSQATVAEFIEGPFIINQEPHPRTGLCMPLIPCQEFGGEVESVGSGVSEDLIGTTGAVLPLIECGSCEFCAVGKEHLCTALAYRGLVGAHGGFQEQVTLSVDDFFPVESHIPPNMIEPLLVATHAAQQLLIGTSLQGSEAPVLIQGAGCIGVCFASILRDVHGLQVLITDPLVNRLETAANAGFETIAYNAVMENTNQYPVVVDAAGKDLGLKQQPLDQALDLCAPGGTIIGIGTYFITLDILPARFLFQEISIIPSFAYAKSDIAELARIQSKLNVDFHALMTKVPFDQIIDDGFYLAELDRNAFTRITTEPFQSQSKRAAA